MAHYDIEEIVREVGQHLGFTDLSLNRNSVIDLLVENNEHIQMEWRDNKFILSYLLTVEEGRWVEAVETLWSMPYIDPDMPENLQLIMAGDHQLVIMFPIPGERLTPAHCIRVLDYMWELRQVRLN